MNGQDAEAITKLHASFLDAFRSSDHEALGAFYTETTAMLPPRGGMLTGREAIVAFWSNAERIQDLRFEPQSIERLGADFMREAGVLQIMVRGQGTVSAKYLSVWIKDGDAWKLDSSIWNIGPAGGGRRGQQGGMARGQGGGGRGAQGSGRRGPGGGQGGRGNRRGGGGYGGGGGRAQGGGGGPRMGDGISPGGRRQGRGGFGRRSRQQRANQDAPMVPRID